MRDPTAALRLAAISSFIAVSGIAGVAAPRALADSAPVYGPAVATASAGQPAAPIPGPAAQSTPGGALSAPGLPEVSRVVCKTSCLGRRKAVPGAVIKVKGQFLDYTQQVVFRGPSGPIPVSLTYRSPILVRAMVPTGAISSRPYVIDTSGRRSNRAPRKLTIKAVSVATPPGSGVFPVQGPHTYGDGFGAPRSGHTHQGQDVLAACGTPLVAVANATVQYAGYQASAAGNYIVLDLNGTEDDVVYMHLAYPAMVRTVNAPVVAGQQIGVVGQTGDATGCHLHFEYWQGDWYGGGQPIDPLPYLLAWDPTN